jgi:hypothetical protein
MNSPVGLLDPINNSQMSQSNKKLMRGSRFVSAPVVKSQRQVNLSPQITHTKKGIVVTHREFVSTIIADNVTPFRVNNNLSPNLYRINPMSAPVFNWLVGIAAHYDQYVFRKLALHYVPLCATTEVGRLALFGDPDSEDQGPADRADLSSYQATADGPVWDSASMVYPCDSKIRLCDDNPTGDPKLIDLGRIGYVTYGTTTNNPLGDLYIEYTVELLVTQPVANMVRALAGTGTSFIGSTGPRFFDGAAIAANFVTFSCVATGNYHIHMIFLGTTTVTTPTTSNGGIVQNFSLTQGVAKSSIMFSLTVPASNVQVQVGFAGAMTAFDFFGYRATRESFATI